MPGRTPVPSPPARRRTAPGGPPIGLPTDVAVHPASSANPILAELARGFAAAGVRVSAFPDTTPRSGLVLLHWSEELWRAPRPRVGAVGRHRRRVRRRQELLAGLDAARGAGSRIVWVRHNALPAAWDERLTDLVERLDAVVHLHAESRDADASRPWAHLPAAVVPHPRYPAPGGHPAPGPTPIREVVMIGGIEPRKRHLPALDAALAVGLPVTVAGKPNDRRLARRLRRRARRRPGTLRLVDRYLPDDELDALLGAARAVLVNQPAQLNSGAVWFALSRSAVVIGPDSPALRAARAVAGPGWVRVLSDLTPAALAAAVAAPIPPGGPPLESLPTGEEFARRVLGLTASLAPGSPRSRGR